MSFTKFVLFEPIGKTRWPPWPLIGLDIFDFSSETAERPAMKLDRKKDLNVFCQVCVFWADRKNKMPPWPIRQKGGTLYSGARYVALWASCFFYRLPLHISLTSTPESLYIFGIVILELYNSVFHPMLGHADRFPFLPLMLTSVYCAIGVTYCWLQFYWNALTHSDRDANSEISYKKQQ